MCYNVVTKFRCVNKHKQAKEDRRKLKHIIKYRTALQTITNTTCPPPLRTTKYVLQEDKSKQNYPKYKKETPLETL